MNAIIYSRYSPRPKDKADKCESLEVQEARCRAYSQAYRWKVIDTDIFREPEVSGKDIEHRPVLQNAIERASAKKAVLVVSSLDRLSRSVVDSIHIVDELRRAGAGLACVSQHVDTSDPSGWLMFTLQAAFAEYERLLISQRTSQGMKHRQANGQKMSKAPPYGYMVDPRDKKRIVVDDNEQRIIGVVCDFRRRGMSLRAICRSLEATGDRARGKRWHHGTIRRILEREGVR